MTYAKWFLYGVLVFLFGIPCVWWGIGSYISINWTQSAMLSGIIVGSSMYYIEITSDPIKEEGEVKD